MLGPPVVSRHISKHYSKYFKSRYFARPIFLIFLPDKFSLSKGLLTLYSSSDLVVARIVVVNTYQQRSMTIHTKKKTTQTKPCIEMMQLSLHQVCWPAILDLDLFARTFCVFHQCRVVQRRVKITQG